MRKKKLFRVLCGTMAVTVLFMAQVPVMAAETDQAVEQTTEQTADQKTDELTETSANQTAENPSENKTSSEEKTTDVSQPAENSGTTETSQVAETEKKEAEKVVVTENDKPYLSLGADLTAEQQHTVLSLMGIDVTKLDQYNVLYINNQEEHQYLDSYIGAEKIGTKSLSSILIMQGEKGSGIQVTTYNINYCTEGMYKNALATAGISDARIIVAGPTGISGTAALCGIFKSYEQMTGKRVSETAMDAAFNELVVTGLLEENLSPEEAQKLEAMIAELKQMMANGELDSKEQIYSVIKELAAKYGLSLTEDQMNQLVDLIWKLKGLDLDWDAVMKQASQWADKFDDFMNESGWGEKILEFFQAIWDWICSLFS